jgi:hypothetical protein
MDALSESGLEMRHSAHTCNIRRKEMQLKQLQKNQSARMARPRTSTFTPRQGVHWVRSCLAPDHDPAGQSTHRSDKPMPGPDGVYLPASQAVQVHPPVWFTVAYNPVEHLSCAQLVELLVLPRLDIFSLACGASALPWPCAMAHIAISAHRACM